jgi:hypothetical protein
LKRLDWGGGRSTKHNQASKRSSSTNHSIEMCRLLSTYYKLFGRQQHRCAEVPKERSRRAIHTHSISCAAFFSAQIKSQHQDSFKTQWRDTDICDACLLASSVATIGARIAFAQIVSLPHPLERVVPQCSYRERESS